MSEESNKEVVTDLGRKLAGLRAAKGWSMAKLAAESGVPRQTIWSVERRGKRLRLDSAARLAQALGVSVQALC